MGLRETVQNAVWSGLKAMGNIPEAATHKALTLVYNPATGVAADTETDTALTRVVFAEYTRQELANEAILPTDVRIIISRKELTTEPKVDSVIVRTAGGVRYSIIRVDTDPAAAVWDVQGRP